MRRPTSRSLTALVLVVGMAGPLAACAPGGDGSAEPSAPVSAAVSGQDSAERSVSPAPREDGQVVATAPDGTELGYQGEDGRTALELLLELDPSAEVQGEGANAYVVGIGGRAADEAEHEFWALYVDGEQAQLGAGSLVTEDGQTITWKLETY